MTRTTSRYRFPASLSLLDAYLQAKGHDTSILKSDRHALDLCMKVSNVRVPFPSKGKRCYSSLRRLHRDLFPGVPMKKAPSRPRRVHGIGLTGPASTCRTVPPEERAAIAREHERAA